MSEPMSVDVQQFFTAYEAKISELISRIVYLEVENGTLRNALTAAQEAAKAEDTKVLEEMD